MSVGDSRGPDAACGVLQMTYPSAITDRFHVPFRLISPGLNLLRKFFCCFSLTVLFSGDGANDVSMIQVADVGVGISGQEGMQVRRHVGGTVWEQEGGMKERWTEGPCEGLGGW